MFAYSIIDCLLQNEYCALAKQLSEFIARLLDQVNDDIELNAILRNNQDVVEDEQTTTTTSKPDRLHNVRLALAYREMQVSTCPRISCVATFQSCCCLTASSSVSYGNKIILVHCTQLSTCGSGLGVS